MSRLRVSLIGLLFALVISAQAQERPAQSAEDRIRALAGIGVTDFVAAEFPAHADEAKRTRALLASIAAG